MKNKSRWDSLSMKDKAALISMYAKGGYTNLDDIRNHYNSFEKGGRLNKFQDGGDTSDDKEVPITANEYITQRLEEIRRKALDKSRTRTLPKVPKILNEESEEDYNNIKEYIISNLDRLNQEKIILERRINLGDVTALKRLNTVNQGIQSSEDWLSKPYEKYKDGASCLYTATDNYGKEYLVSGNQSFASNPGKYGFKKVEKTEMAPGDIVQDISQGYPSHAMIYNGKNKSGVDTFNYSKGGSSEEDIVKGGTYRNVPLDVFRFVGTAKDSTQYINDYNKIYGNKFQDGGEKNTINSRHAKLLARRGMPGDIEALRAAGYDKHGNPIVVFGGGSFSGGGAGGEFDTANIKSEDYDYIRNTPLLHSFSDAFSNARKAGKNTFIFNGKEYTTEISDNPNYVGKQYEPILNIREVLDKNMKVMPDSTKIEPYLGQIPGTSKREYNDGGNLVLRDESPIYNSWNSAIDNSWYKPVYDNLYVGTVPYRSMYKNKDANTKLNSSNSISEFIQTMYPIVEQSMIDKDRSLKNVDNMLAQIAYESSYGKSPRGNGYNLAGIKEFDESKSRTRHTDGEYYKNFEDYRDFADYYTDLINNRYEVENAEGLKDYVERLHGKNSSGKSYSTNSRYYRNMKNMKTFKKELNKYKKDN